LTDIVDKIRKHENNNTVEIIDLIINENFNVQRGLVYSYDEDTVVKRIYTTQNPQEAVDRVNSVVPGYIKYWQRPNNSQIVLYLKKYKGNHPVFSSDVIKDKNFAIKVLHACLDFKASAYPYTMNDYCAGNILINGDEINFVDLDQIFYNDRDDLPPDGYYRRMQWLHKWLSEEEFMEIWNSKF